MKQKHFGHEECPKAAPAIHCTHWDSGMEICCECDKVCWVDSDLLRRVQTYLNECLTTND